MEDFDKIGGEWTLRSVWNDLKSELRVHGIKRSLSEEESDTDRMDKKLYCCLDLSGTCNRLGEIGIFSEESNCSIERANEDIDIDQEMSLLLERTRDRGDVDRLIEEAKVLAVEALEGVPDLPTSSESWDDSELSDSGNSETQWG